MSLIDESGERYVRMANLATVASHHVNGVAQLHSNLLKNTVLSDFAALWPEKLCNVTNGVNPRRFVAVANPGLTRLISEPHRGRLATGLARTARLGSFRDRHGFSDAVARGEARRQTKAWPLS